MTLSSVMFYTGENPYTGEAVYVARSQDDKRRQKAYFFQDKGKRFEKKSSARTAPLISKGGAEPRRVDRKDFSVKRKSHRR
jgi:hypothetical protein